MVAAVLVAHPVFAQGPLSRVGFIDRLDGPIVTSAAASAPNASVPAINVHLPLAPGAAGAASGFAAFDTRLAAYAADPSVRVVVDLRPDPQLSDERWSQFVELAFERYRGRVSAYLLRFGATRPAAEPAAFLIKRTAIALRAVDQQALFGVGRIDAADVPWLTELYRLDLAAYVDVVGVGPDDPGVVMLVAAQDADATIIALDRELPDLPALAAQRFVETQLDHLDSRIAAISYVAGAGAIGAVMPPLRALSVLLSQGTAPVDAPITRATGPDGRDARSRLQVRGTFGLGSGTPFLIYTLSGGPVTVDVTERSGTTPRIIDAVSGRRIAAEGFVYTAATATARFTLPPTPVPWVVDWSEGSADVLIERQSVEAERLPSAIEIIARHQQAQAVQGRLLRTAIADLWMKQSFRTGATDPGFDVVTENRLFTEAAQTEWEERSFRLNGTRWGPDRPPFPLLQPEKVLSLPLELRLGTDYRYRLEGIETIRDREAYRLSFEPVDGARSLFRGTVWIDRRTFARARLHTVQTQLSPPVISSEETQEFTEVGTIETQPIVLATSSVGYQSMLIAGRTLAVERALRFSRFQLNPGDFAAAREAARQGANIMYRDTDAGLRYLVKRDGRRVVSEMTTTSAKAMALGVTYDPSFDFPIPLGGLNYLDFDFLGKDNQLAMVFGGVLALINVQRPRLWSDRFDASVDLFAIAIKGNDRTYDARGERPGERVQTLPFSTGVNLGWRLSQFHRAVFQYQFRFDGAWPDEQTAADFTVPNSTVTNGVGLTWDWKRAGYGSQVSATRHVRSSWRTWGYQANPEHGSASYLKYSASLNRDVSFGLHKIHLNVAYYGGERLDRFSAYQFGFFDDHRIHGVPASGLRFAELGMVRGSYSFNLFDQYRFDVFLDHARGREDAAAPSWEPVTGIGFGFNVRGPRGTMLRGDIGKGLLPERFRHPGSLVFQFQILKPLP